MFLGSGNHPEGAEPAGEGRGSVPWPPSGQAGLCPARFPVWRPRDDQDQLVHDPDFDIVKPSPATHAIWTSLKAGECITGYFNSDLVPKRLFIGTHTGTGTVSGHFLATRRCLNLRLPAFIACNGRRGEVKTWRALEALVDQGKVRSIGVSNFQEWEMERIFAAKPKCLQGAPAQLACGPGHLNTLCFPKIENVRNTARDLKTI